MTRIAILAAVSATVLTLGPSPDGPSPHAPPNVDAHGGVRGEPCPIHYGVRWCEPLPTRMVSSPVPG